jgi:hypothetical protein
MQLPVYNINGITHDRTMRAIAALAVVFGFLTCCRAQNSIEIADIQNAPSVSGTLVVAQVRFLDPHVEQPAPEPIEDATVCEASDDWKAELECTAMDKQGHWSLPSSPQRQIYRIKFVKAGFSPVFIRLQVRRKAKPLTVGMPVAA